MKRVLFIIVLTALLMATTGTASAEPTRKQFSGADYCGDPIWGPDMYPGHNWQGRGILSVCEMDVPGFPELTGTEYLGKGQWLVVGRPGDWNQILMGTDRLEVEGGAWEGSWVFSPNADTFKIALHGEGQYAGWHVQMILTPVYDENDPASDRFTGYIQYNGR